jgi:hypothetical protein
MPIAGATRVLERLLERALGVTCAAEEESHPRNEAPSLGQSGLVVEALEERDGFFGELEPASRGQGRIRLRRDLQASQLRQGGDPLVAQRPAAGQRLVEQLCGSDQVAAVEEGSRKDQEGLQPQRVTRR